MKYWFIAGLIAIFLAGVCEQFHYDVIATSFRLIAFIVMIAVFALCVKKGVDGEI